MPATVQKSDRLCPQCRERQRPSPRAKLCNVCSGRYVTKAMRDAEKRTVPLSQHVMQPCTICGGIVPPCDPTKWHDSWCHSGVPCESALFRRLQAEHDTAKANAAIPKVEDR